MNTVDFIIIGVIAIAVVIAVIVIISRKRSGKCCSSCEGCVKKCRRG